MSLASSLSISRSTYCKPSNLGILRIYSNSSTYSKPRIISISSLNFAKARIVLNYCERRNASGNTNPMKLSIGSVHSKTASQRLPIIVLIVDCASRLKTGKRLY